ncbi:MAG: Rnf-Nqr domain containing protein [Huintestinicola sp.]
MNGTEFEITGYISSLLLSLCTSVLAENIVFARAIGTNTMMIAAKNRRNLRGVCLGVTYMSVVAALIMGLLRTRIQALGDIGMMLPFIFTVIISIVYIITLVLARLVFGQGFGKMKKYVHISAFNSAVMGTMFLSMRTCTTMIEYAIFGLGIGLGFTCGSYAMSAVRPALFSQNTPKAFRGFPAAMLFVGIMAMALYGVLGHSPSYI